MSVEREPTNHTLSDTWQAVRRIAGQLSRDQRRHLLIALVAMGLAGALASALPLILAGLVDHLDPRAIAPLAGVWPYLAALLVAIGLREALQVARKRLVEGVCTRVEKAQRVALTGHLLRSRLDQLQARRIGSLHGRLNRGVEGLVRLIKLAFQDLLPATLLAVAALVVIVVRMPIPLALVMAMVIPVGTTLVLAQIASQKGIRLDLLRKKNRLDGLTVELLSCAESVRAFNGEPRETARVADKCEGLRAKEMRHHVMMANYDAAKYVNEGLFLVLTITVAVFYAAHGELSAGEILAVALLFNSITTPLRELHRLLDEAHEATLRTQDFFAMLDWEVDPSCTAQPVREVTVPGPTSDPHGSLRLERVRFGYPGKEALLKDVSLKIPPGSHVGLVGLSGCGKSTLLRLLIRILEPTSGRVVIGGRDRCSLSRAELAARMILVSQSPFILSGSVRENIAYGWPEAPLSEIEQAARRAGIYDSISALPNGFDEMISEQGSNLSGGEKQRIALARAFLAPPQILLLDEATSALDNARAEQVIGALASTMAGKTMLVVAHKLATLRDLDRIVVLDGGQVVDQGTFDELAARPGLFQRLARSEDASPNSARPTGDLSHTLCHDQAFRLA